MLLQVSLALVITYQMLTFADFDAVALILAPKNLPLQLTCSIFASAWTVQAAGGPEVSLPTYF